MKKLLYIITLLFSVFALGQSSDQNYILTSTYTQEGGSGKKISITYFDGLGRPIQQIAAGQAANGQDVVNHIEYDSLGRQTKDFLPIVREQGLDYSSLVADDIISDYTSPSSPSQEATAYPYSEKLMENSPLNRLLKQAAPGESWRMGTNHEVKFAYQTNDSTEVKHYGVGTNWNTSHELYDISFVEKGYHKKHTLYKTITKDENWESGSDNTTEEFKDKEGRVVLKRTYNNGVKHDTYYVYDEYGNLTYVLPPLVNTAVTVSANDLNGLCYQYKYDNRNRLVEKKLPGKQWEFIVYNSQDMVVATGPALNPFGGTEQGWMITRYDIFGRVAYTGWYDGEDTTSEGRVEILSTLSASNWAEERVADALTLDGVQISYSNVAFPKMTKLLTVTYYDDYLYKGGPSSIPTQIEDQSVLIHPKTLVTGTWVRMLTSPTEQKAELTHLFYDAKARTIRTKKGAEGFRRFVQIDTKFDFVGKTLYTITTHRRTNADPILTVRDEFEYTEQDRLLVHKHQINNNPWQLLAKNEYDDLGQLMSKQVGGEDVTTHIGLQKVDYRYNIRGWLKGINDIDNIISTTDLFAFKLNYDEVEDETNYTGKALFNGNISETYWRTSNDDIKRKYGYKYDDLNRLTDAIYQKPDAAVPVTSSYNESLTYDKNGNIMSLQRNGEFDDEEYVLEIDNLVYTYDTINGNQLKTVADNSINPNGFKDDTANTVDYDYDANGNMRKDFNKNIQNITYNHLNLPTEILFFGSDTRKINYLYNAVGQKLAKTVTDNTSVIITEYLDGFQYVKNGEGITKLVFFPHAEGYVNNTIVDDENVFNYVFNYTDHLGNIRLSYGFDTAEGVVRILEENNYYPFGLKHKNYNMSHKGYYYGYYTVTPPTKIIEPIGENVQSYYDYKYNGKEYQDELGLNMYDYGARNYDPALGRWMNIDPLSEKYVGLSPYSFAANSPILLTDPDGRDIVFSWQRDDSGNITGINISITGKVIDDTKKKKISERQMQKYKDRIVKGLTENIKSDDKNFSINVTANIDIAQSEDDLSDTDHAFRITDEIKEKVGNTDPNIDVNGFSEKGENFVYLDENFTGRTVAHEIGHSAGLSHIKEEKKNGEYGKPTDYLGFSSTGYKHYRFYTTNFYPGNLMHQSLDPSPGNKLTRWQFNKMMSLYETKQLNKGKQKQIK